MGQVQTQTKIEQQYDIVKLRQDGSALLQHKNNQDQFLLRSVSSNIGEQLKCFEDILRKRQQVKSPHLLDLIQIRKKEEKNVCSVVHKMYLLIEFPFKTLRDEIMDKISQSKFVPFLEAELWSILYSCCMGMNVLYEKKMPHQCISSSQIYINRDGLIKISDPILLGLEKNYIKVLKNSEQHVHISPEVISFLDDCNFSFYDKEKSDIFVLAAIMLEASLLRSIQLFDRQTKKPYLDIIPIAINELRQKYSSSFCQIIEKMLQLHSKFRPKFSEIINMIEKDNSLYESTDQTTFQQTRHSASNAKNSQNQNTVPKASWSKPKIDKKQTVGPENAKQRTTNNSNPKLTPIQGSKDETIIKMLQTENFQNSINKNHLPSQTPPPIYMPINQPQFIFHQHPPIYQQPVVLPNYHLPPSVHSNYPTSNSHLNYLPISNFQPNRYNQQDRFSFTKFGNIVLNNPHKQKPLFSYEIPEINQILKSHMNPRVGQPSSSPNLHKPKTPERARQMVQNKNSPFIRPQHIAISPVRVFEESKFADQLKKPINPQINQIQEKKQMSPQKTSFQNEVYLNLNFVENQTKETPKMKERNLRPIQNNKISLNGKKHEIFSVTEKSQESVDTSPAKIIPSQNSSVKIKEPQKSPGLQFSNHLRTPSSKKQMNTPISQENEKYVIIMLEGGGRYEGYMKNGMKNGEGKLQFNDGGYYVGEWRDNKMHGYGKLHYQNGQVAYEGNWEDDEFCGFGRVFNDRPQKMSEPFNYHDFAQINEKWIYYEGQFRNDSKHGKGKLRLTNGEVFEGNFVFDSIEGEGTFYTCKNEQIKGFWRDNMLITK